MSSPARISSRFQLIGPPLCCSHPCDLQSNGKLPSFASRNWKVSPRIVDSTLSRMRSAMTWHASSRVAAMMLTRWKKSASPGNDWIFDWAAEPESARAPSATPSMSGSFTTSPILRNRSSSFGLKSSMLTRWPNVPDARSTTTSAPSFLSFMASSHAAMSASSIVIPSRLADSAMRWMSSLSLIVASPSRSGSRGTARPGPGRLQARCAPAYDRRGTEARDIACWSGSTSRRGCRARTT